MPRKRRVKRQWTNPLVLGPIATVIAAIITAIVSPVVVPMIQHWLEQSPPGRGANEPPVGKFSLRTDKGTYGWGDLVKVSGTLDKLVQGKTVRVDVYDPKGRIFQPFNESFSSGPRDEWTEAYPRLSDIEIKPNNKGLFSYLFPLAGPLSGQIIKGNYTIEVTYGGMTGNATFTVR